MELIILDNYVKTKLTVLSTQRLLITKDGEKIIKGIDGFNLAQNPNTKDFYLVEENENPRLKNTKSGIYKTLYGRIVDKLNMPHLTKLDMLEVEKYNGMRCFKLVVIPEKDKKQNTTRGKK
jgi:hypothetical protein